MRALTLSYGTFEFLKSLCIFCAAKLQPGKSFFGEQHRKLRIVMMDKASFTLTSHIKGEHHMCLCVCMRHVRDAVTSQQAEQHNSLSEWRLDISSKA